MPDVQVTDLGVRARNDIDGTEQIALSLGQTVPPQRTALDNLLSNTNPLDPGPATPGSSHLFTRADHRHNDTAPQPYTSSPAAPTASGAAGLSTRFARGDHAHPEAASGLTVIWEAGPGRNTWQSAISTPGRRYLRGSHRFSAWKYLMLWTDNGDAAADEQATAIGVASDFRAGIDLVYHSDNRYTLIEYVNDTSFNLSGSGMRFHKLWGFNRL